MSLPATYFDQIYASNRDPWGFETRWYEERKYDVTLASLPRSSYQRGLEIGCSIGVFTAMLAGRCEALLAVDTSAAALTAAKARLVGNDHVELRQMAVPGGWPEGEFDLIMLSEVGYYFAAAELDRLLQRIEASLSADGVLVAVHWRHPVAEYPLRGDEVHERIGALDGLESMVDHVEADFRLAVLGRAPVTSVAREGGLLG